MQHMVLMKASGLAAQFQPTPTDEAQAMLRDRYGIEAALRRLTTEKDDTFLASAEDGSKFVLKMANPDENPQEVALQADALEHIATRDPGLPVPRLVRCRQGAPWLRHIDTHSQVRTVHLLSFLPGSLLDGLATTPNQRRLCGRMLARLRLSLKDYSHPGSSRTLPWSVQHLDGLSDLLGHIPDPDHRRMTEIALNRFADLAPQLRECRMQVLHNDFTLSNVLVDPASPDFVSGVIDFGDIVHTYIVADLATAMLSQLAPSGQGDAIFAPARDLFAGYLEIGDLTGTEQRLLPHLIMARLCTRILITTWRSAQFPDNSAYILRNMSSAWAWLSHFVNCPAEQIDNTFL